jgi:hypothetical protein
MPETRKHKHPFESQVVSALEGTRLVAKHPDDLSIDPAGVEKPVTRRGKNHPPEPALVEKLIEFIKKI